MELPKEDRPGGGELLHHGAIVIRHPVGKHLGPTGRGNIPGATQIFHGHWYAMQRAPIATACNVSFRRSGLYHGRLGEDRDITVETLVEPGDTVEYMARQLDRREVTCLHALGNRSQRFKGKIGHVVLSTLG
jgi:hypothetical protein